ncbi:MAG: hypothetical protein CM15mP62_24440 [Rhodospirillaceae bacterium]|nr:MAG: hypothetical protein CM15mP62_24440 [Rhodospirillaceae bacterium]
MPKPRKINVLPSRLTGLNDITALVNIRNSIDFSISDDRCASEDAPPTLQTGNRTLYVVHHLVIDWERLKLSFPSKENGFSQINYCLEGILDPLP